MSPQDAMFLHVENDVTPMHIGGVSIFEGPPPPFDDLRAMVQGKLDLTPRYRQKVRFVPLGMGEPVWVDDPHFNLGYHLRHTAVPSPGTEKQLRATAARVFSQHLDRSKPLWEIWMVEGLEDYHWALLSKVHHCMVDGVAATDMMSLLFGERPESGNGQVWQPEPEPSGLDLIAYSARHRVRDPAAQIRFVLRAPSEALRAAAGVARSLAAAAPAMRPATSSLTGSIGPHRVWSWANVPLASIKHVRAELGGTVNDVVLTLITNGYRQLLESRGESISTADVIRTMVPVSVRKPGESGVYNNRVSAVFARLPVGIEDPGSSHRSRPSPEMPSPSSPGSRRRCCWRLAAAWRRARPGSTWTRRPPTCPAPSSRCTPWIESCSRRIRMSRSWERSGSSSRSSRTTASSTSASPATATTLPTSTSSAPASRRTSIACSSAWGPPKTAVCGRK
jgi:WS/DGAT/MGAT family acyltransferase